MAKHKKRKLPRARYRCGNCGKPIYNPKPDGVVPVGRATCFPRLRELCKPGSQPCPCWVPLCDECLDTLDLADGRFRQRPDLTPRGNG